MVGELQVANRQPAEPILPADLVAKLRHVHPNYMANLYYTPINLLNQDTHAVYTFSKEIEGQNGTGTTMTVSKEQNGILYYIIFYSYENQLPEVLRQMELVLPVAFQDENLSNIKPASD